MKLMWLRRLKDEQGSGTILTLAAISTILALTVGLLSFLSVFDQWSQAKRTADQAALSGALDILRDQAHVCMAAAEIVGANQLVMDSCAQVEDYVAVHVSFVPRAQLARMAMGKVQVFGVAKLQAGS